MTPLPWPDLTERQWKAVLHKAAVARATGEPVPPITDTVPDVPEDVPLAQDMDEDEAGDLTVP